MIFRRLMTAPGFYRVLLMSISLLPVVACDGSTAAQGPNNPAVAPLSAGDTAVNVTNSNDATTSAPGATSAQVQTQIETLMAAPATQSALAAAPSLSQCSTQEQALKTIIKTYVQQIQAAGKAPDQASLTAFLQQMQSAVHDLVTCVCASNASLNNCQGVTTK